MKIELFGIKELGFAIYKERNNQGMAANDLAHMAGVAASTLSAFEHGRRGIADGHLVKICEVLKIDVNIAVIKK